MFFWRKSVVIMSFCAGLCLATSSVYAVIPGLPQFSSTDLQILDSVIDESDARNWQNGITISRGSSDPAVVRLAHWLSLRNGQGTWDEYAYFLANYPNWPKEVTLRRYAESLMPNDLHPDQVISFFNGTDPLTAKGYRILGEALITQGEKAQGEALVAYGWINKSMSQRDENEYLERHGSVLRNRHVERVDTALWAGRTSDAMRLYPYLNPEWRALANARTGLRSQSGNADKLVSGVSPALQTHPGLAFERMRWRYKKGLRNEAESMILLTSREWASLGRPQEWAYYRKIFARDAFEEGLYEKAYELANYNNLTNGVDFADLEFLAGWVALEYIKDPKRADTHFVRLWEGVRYPVSKSRAAYWAGRAREALKDSSGATTWYTRAAEFGTTFYGQLAARKLARPALRGFSANSPITKADIEVFQKSDIARLAVALTRTKHENTARIFMLQAAEVLNTEGALGVLGSINLQTNEPNFAVQVAKIAIRKGFKVPQYAYPVVPLAVRADAPEQALSLAIARQESQMNPRAKSPAGALGLMQVMPATAKGVARRIGVTYDLDLLGRDIDYNTNIGQAYLTGLVNRWNGSYVLAIASYNAGPGNVSKWIERFGDPRTAAVDEINWIESIPFSETRNYVQRVLEGMEVYRNRLGQN